MKIFFQKKPLTIFLGFLFLLGVIPVVILAIGGQESYKSFPLADPLASNLSTDPVGSKTGLAIIINRSDKTYLVPNKSSNEWNSFAKYTPQYVGLSVCGDKICSEAETAATCRNDCPLPTGYCGDGICDKSTSTLTKVTFATPQPDHVDYDEVCVENLSPWRWVPLLGLIVMALDENGGSTWECNTTERTIYVSSGERYGSETWDTVVPNTKMSTCKDDCAAPVTAGCGVCGFANGAQCPNRCGDGGYNMINCVFQPAYTVTPTGGGVAFNNKSIKKKYLTAADALAITIDERFAGEDNSYTVAARYACDFGASITNFCPAGSYCSLTGGMKPNTTITSYATTAWLTSIGKTAADLQKTCDAGYFCPVGASYERPCPNNTYSLAGADKCTACPVGTKSLGKSGSAARCVLALKSGDGFCNTGETPINSPFDCPSASQAGTLWKGDRRCTGAETMANSPQDCSCGDGDCNNGESYLSCMTDCFFMDSVCGSKIVTKATTTIFREGNVGKRNGNSSFPNESDCKYMNAGEVCGNGTCESGEGYNSSLTPGRIVCTLDCHCGDNICNYGETYSSCSSDCHCGDGTCNYSETAYFCATDCHCGNGNCESSYGENASTCYADCKCGDNICSSGETASSCATDCATACNNNGVCNTGETRVSCADCKGIIMPPIEQ